LEASKENPIALDAIRLLLLTGFRRMEAMALPRPWIDPQARCIRFGDTEERGAVRIIGALAVCLLEALSARAVSPWVFPGETGQGARYYIVRMASAETKAEVVTPHLQFTNNEGRSNPHPRPSVRRWRIDR
jgi:integrase